jgi:hypothetical protein
MLRRDAAAWCCAASRPRGHPPSRIAPRSIPGRFAESCYFRCLVGTMTFGERLRASYRSFARRSVASQRSSSNRDTRRSGGVRTRCRVRTSDLLHVRPHARLLRSVATGRDARRLLGPFPSRACASRRRAARPRSPVAPTRGRGPPFSRRRRRRRTRRRRESAASRTPLGRERRAQLAWIHPSQPQPPRARIDRRLAGGTVGAAAPIRAMSGKYAFSTARTTDLQGCHREDTASDAAWCENPGRVNSLPRGDELPWLREALTSSGREVRVDRRRTSRQERRRGLVHRCAWSVGRGASARRSWSSSPIS